MCPSGARYRCKEVQHAAAALHRALIIFTSRTPTPLPPLPPSHSLFFPLICASSVSGMLEILLFFPFFQGILWSFTRSLLTLSLLPPPPPPHPALGEPLYFLPHSLFFLPHLPLFLPPPLSPSHLSDLNACIMHGEGKASRRPACANNAPK